MKSFYGRVKINYAEFFCADKLKNIKVLSISYSCKHVENCFYLNLLTLTDFLISNCKWVSSKFRSVDILKFLWRHLSIAIAY